MKGEKTVVCFVLAYLLGYISGLQKYYQYYGHAQSCLTIYEPMDCSPPGSSVHGTFQARILEWVAISSSRGSSLPRDRTHVSSVSCIGRWILLPLSYLGSPCSKYSSMWQRGFTSLRVPISPTIPMIFLLSFMFILVSSEISFPKTLGFCGFN